MERTGSTTDPPGSGYLFEGFRLYSEGKLFRGEAAVELTDPERRVLFALVARPGQVVTHAQLRQAMAALERNLGEEIPQVISSLNRRLGIAGCIEAVYKRGFRFCCEVRTYTSAQGIAHPRLAILPFSAGMDVPEYLTEALTEETGRRLKAAGVLQVLEQHSVTTLTRRSMSPAEVGSAMQAELVLAGALHALPGRFRLRIEMLRGIDGGSLWGEDFVLAEKRVSVLAKELANRISMRIGGAVSFAASESTEEEPYSQEAHELLWRAHSEWRTMQRHQMQDGLQRLQRVVELAPLWMEARIELANLCAIQAMYGFMAPQAAANKIRHAAEGALERGSEALLPTLGWVSFYADRDLCAAQWAFARSSHLPYDRWIARNRVMFALSLRRFSEAIEMLEQCIRQDPYSAGLHALLAWTLHLAVEAGESVKRIEYGLKEFPEHELTKLFAAIILAYNGEAKRAVTIGEEVVRRSPYLDPGISVYAYALACAGRKDEAQGRLEQLEWLSRERFVLHAFTPAVQVALGEYDAAVDELRASDQLRCPWFFQMLADPRLKPLRERKDFQELAAILPRMEAEAAGESY